MKVINVIASVTKDGSIGNSETNSLIYRNKSDMNLFRSTTKGATIIMGANTWRSLPVKPLRGRNNVVISSSIKEGPDFKVYNSLEEALEKIKGYIFIIGGASLYGKIQELDIPVKYYFSEWDDERLTGDIKFPNYKELCENLHITKIYHYPEFKLKVYMNEH